MTAYRWVEQYCMLVSDIPKKIELHVFSQPVNLPTPLAVKSKDATPPQYALRSSGYAKSIIEVNKISSNSIYYVYFWSPLLACQPVNPMVNIEFIYRL